LSSTAVRDVIASAQWKTLQSSPGRHACNQQAAAVAADVIAPHEECEQFGGPKRETIVEEDPVSPAVVRYLKDLHETGNLFLADGEASSRC
jgi:hypothetical protein